MASELLHGLGNQVRKVWGIGHLTDYSGLTAPPSDSPVQTVTQAHFDTDHDRTVSGSSHHVVGYEETPEFFSEDEEDLSARMKALLKQSQVLLQQKEKQATFHLTEEHLRAHNEAVRVQEERGGTFSDIGQPREVGEYGDRYAWSEADKNSIGSVSDWLPDREDREDGSELGSIRGKSELVDVHEELIIERAKQSPEYQAALRMTSQEITSYIDREYEYLDFSVVMALTELRDHKAQQEALGAPVRVIQPHRVEHGSRSSAAVHTDQPPSLGARPQENELLLDH